MRITARQRVLVALDPGVPLATALQAVLSVAGPDVAEVVGLFVEDEVLLSLARLSAVREVTVEASARPLSAEQVERQFRAQAARLRGLFEAEAARAGLPYRFEVARGETSREVLKAAAGCDLLVVAHSRSQTMRTLVARLGIWEEPAVSPPTLLFLQERWPTGRTVATLFRGAEDRPLLERAVQLARTERLELVLFTSAPGVEAAGRVAAGQIGMAPAVRYRRIADTGAAALARAAASDDVRALVLPADLILAAPLLVPELLRRVACSVIAVRARADD